MIRPQRANEKGWAYEPFKSADIFKDCFERPALTQEGTHLLNNTSSDKQAMKSTWAKTLSERLKLWRLSSNTGMSPEFLFEKHVCELKKGL